MKHLILSLIPLLCLLPLPSFGADGDVCDADTDQFRRGAYTTVGCFQLCDTKVAANSSCTEFDLNATSTAGRRVGSSDLIVFEYEENGSDCTATPDFTITTGPVTGGAPLYDLDTTPVILNSTVNRVVLDMSRAPTDRYLFTAILDDADCTDVDIRMYLLDHRPR